MTNDISNPIIPQASDTNLNTHTSTVRSVLIRDLSSDEKPREKAERLGIEALTDVEMLALLLGSGMAGKSVIDLAREILHDNDNKLSRLSRLNINELKNKYKGVGTAKAVLLSAAMAFGARVQQSLASDNDQPLTSSSLVYNYMRHRVERLNYEEFWILHLNRANKVISTERISKGGISSTSVDIKLIAKSAIDKLSSAIILIHNHPSGNLRSSTQDDQLTRRIVDICKVVDVAVVDHLIISSTGYYSYRDQGKL